MMGASLAVEFQRPEILLMPLRTAVTQRRNAALVLIFGLIVLSVNYQLVWPGFQGRQSWWPATIVLAPPFIISGLCGVIHPKMAWFYTPGFDPQAVPKWVKVLSVGLVCVAVLAGVVAMLFLTYRRFGRIL
jgi:hypothetical protein